VFFRPRVRTLRRAASQGKRVIHTNSKSKEENDVPHPARRPEHRRPRDRGAAEFRQEIQDRGVVADEGVERLRRAGYNDGEVGEIVAIVALNLFTNSFNHVAATELDFPAAPDLAAR
jgi:hypothetical protein